MENQDLTIAFWVERTAEEAFAAINHVRGWWSGEIDGGTNKVGDEFTYRYSNVHRSKQKITELVPGKKIVWQVLDSHLSSLKDPSEWNGTNIVFEIREKDGQTEVRFTHAGLAPQIECYGRRSNAWGRLIGNNLRQLIATGKDQPDAFA